MWTLLDMAHYLPHHAVKKESATTPIRVVFDYSSRSSNNSPSLNDYLIVGPPFLSDTLYHHKISILQLRPGLSTDIEKVFHFKMALFDSTSSPFMLNALLHHHLENYSTPVAKDIGDKVYVDNVISRCDQETEIISYYQEARSIVNAAKFNLHSWASDSLLYFSVKKHNKIKQLIQAL